MLFNFQGPSLSFDSLFILAHRFSFVNTFFKTFLSFFSVDFENRFAMRFSGGLSSSLQDRSPERLNIISHPIPNVNTFFYLFSAFFGIFYFSTCINKFPQIFPQIILFFSLISVFFMPKDIFSSISWKTPSKQIQYLIEYVFHQDD